MVGVRGLTAACSLPRDVLGSLAPLTHKQRLASCRPRSEAFSDKKDMESVSRAVFV